MKGVGLEVYLQCQHNKYHISQLPSLISLGNLYSKTSNLTHHRDPSVVHMLDHKLTSARGHHFEVNFRLHEERHSSEQFFPFLFYCAF
eukprot:TRINITY_DN9229_c0_g1_i1.p1 TRINITY_DN9229_c0_g1~~TRINITY_DN9229_c0_g1_i1.p1  ORF type:complete len:88 (-),score=7.92 TRINITY_DN9229_c0_g1_i1:59-322(-)